ncbi:MAG: protein kinase [Planctomycetota bacterium]|nr:protein kinase [Planctomycetota bacterium]
MLTPGTRIGGFLIGELLGKGAMGEVYRGEQLSLKRPVAIKRIATHLMENEEMVRRFKREAQVLARLSHPNIVGVIECEEFPDPQGHRHLLLIMELIDGGRSLRSYLQGPIDWRVATAIIRMCAEGLAAAYEQHVVHRDIKPDNIMMTKKGIAKLVDFGLAKATESTALTMQSAPMGTPLFMSPEACRGEEIGHAGDLYSLGVTWWLMLTGQYPFQAANIHGLLFKHISEPLPPPTGLFDHVPQPIVQLVYQCLEKRPERRPESAIKLVEAIEGLATQGLVIPRHARNLVESARGSVETQANAASTASTLVAGTLHPSALPSPTIDRTAATIMQGAPAQASAPPASNAPPRPTADAAVPIVAASQPKRRWLLQGAAAAMIVVAAGVAVWWVMTPHRDSLLRESRSLQRTATLPATHAETPAVSATMSSVSPLSDSLPAAASSAESQPEAPRQQAPQAPDPAAPLADSTAMPSDTPGGATMSAVSVQTATSAVATTSSPKLAAVQPATQTATEPAAPTSHAVDPLPSSASASPSPSLLPPDTTAGHAVAPIPKNAASTAQAASSPAAAAPLEFAPQPALPASAPTTAPGSDPPVAPAVSQSAAQRTVPLSSNFPEATVFERELAAKNWDGAKQAALALPEPARSQALEQLTKTANAQLITAMKEARTFFAAGDYQAAATILAREIAAAPHADRQIREAYVKLARSVRDAAREAGPKP